MTRPSAAFTHDELCDEFDWMYEFSSRMAERIRNDPDVHNLVAYVEKLEGQNKELRELARDYLIFYSQPGCTYCFCHDECRKSDGPCMAGERLVDRTNKLGIEMVK